MVCPAGSGCPAPGHLVGEQHGNAELFGGGLHQPCCRRDLEVAEDAGVTEVVAFATSAIREAPNGDSVLAEVTKPVSYTHLS